MNQEDIDMAIFDRPARSLIVVGDWIKRDKRGAPHLVESLVSGDVVANCGRRMKDEPNGDGGLVKVPPTTPLCKVCQPPWLVT